LLLPNQDHIEFYAKDILARKAEMLGNLDPVKMLEGIESYRKRADSLAVEVLIEIPIKILCLCA
jgi:hypothetical protein